MNSFYSGLLGDVFVQQTSGRQFGEDRIFRRVVLSAYADVAAMPALELGCGYGRLLIELVQDGIKVEGIDLSSEMVDACRAGLVERGLDAPVHLGEFAPLSPGLRSYASMYCPLNSFSLIADDDAASEALRSFRSHLEPGGVVALSASGRCEDHGSMSMSLRHTLTLDSGPRRGFQVRVFEARARCRCGQHVQVRRRADSLAPIADAEWRKGEIETQLRRVWQPEDLAASLRRAGFGEIRMIGGAGDYVMVGAA
ncbi:methyltransferase domain-containing protein [Nocardioides zeae]|uniref:Class I SAM-dependent methyltransferase n=1 Tax=Nocardioides zeae TaxID=1457234 RepID=A0A6P0HM74_9ACTN|nr:class I SAM-dependent methyltransferase [Nocardioides zeae]